MVMMPGRMEYRTRSQASVVERVVVWVVFLLFSSYGVRAHAPVTLDRWICSHEIPSWALDFRMISGRGAV